MTTVRIPTRDVPAAGGSGPASAGRRTGTLRRRMVAHRWHYLFLVPMLVLFVMFTVYPMLATVWYSFFQWDGYGSPTNWIGAQNYSSVWSSSLFWHAFLHSLFFSIFALVVEMPLALLVAIVLNNPRLKGRNFYRLLIFLPVVTTTAVVGVVWAILLSPTGGPINDVLVNSGLVDSPVNFLGSERLALPTVILVETWKSIGVTVVYWIAALQAIPKDMYEAARIDGARARQILMRITVPMLTPFAVVIALLTFQRSLNPFDLVQTMTAGGPNNATDVAGTFIYRQAFNPELGAPQFGYASAAGLVFAAAVLVLTGVQALLGRRFRDKEEDARVVAR